MTPRDAKRARNTVGLYLILFDVGFVVGGYEVKHGAVARVVVTVKTKGIGSYGGIKPAILSDSILAVVNTLGGEYSKGIDTMHGARLFCSLLWCGSILFIWSALS